MRSNCFVDRLYWTVRSSSSQAGKFSVTDASIHTCDLAEH
jgi:hypothetical protein